MPVKFKIQRAGSYVVKSAESPATTVTPKVGRPSTPPSAPSDQQLARAVRELKQKSSTS